MGRILFDPSLQVEGARADDAAVDDQETQPARRRVFLGDIQGCLDELRRLLDAVRFDPAADELHPVGDFVNRGPDSAGVLRLCRELDAGGVLGNHDVHLLRRAAGLRDAGNRDTIEDVLEAEDREELLAWLAARPFVREFEDTVCVHAGIHPSWSSPAADLAEVDPLVPDPRSDFATRIRYCDANGQAPEADWPPPPEPFGPWYRTWQARDDDRTVVFGHWARGGLVELDRVRGLDTGCVWGKELTAWIPQEDRFVHVPAARVYSPPSL